MKQCAVLLSVLLALMGTSCAQPMTSLRVAPDRRAAQPATAVPAERAPDRSDSAKNPLTIAVTPQVASERALVVVRARVEPDPRSRMLTIEWWSDEGVGGSHMISLEGDRAPTRHDYEIKRVGAGDYVVSATLARNDGTQIRRSTALVVTGRPPTMR